MKTSALFFSALSLLVPIVLLPLVEAHGIVGDVTIDGKKYQGPIAGGGSLAGSPVRQISDASPVKGATNKAVTCGPNAKPAPFVAPANPGSTIDVLWTANDRQHWPHNTGPMLTYLASCGSVSCDKFDASNAQWFKINEVGKRSGGWVQQDQFDGKAHSFKLPSNLASGGYLLRHEIIALHLADQPGGAEFYPSCIQIKVGGSQTGAPSPDELVKLPGAYKDNDPGILVNAFDDSAYKFPGPAVSKLASTSSNDGSNNGDTGSDGSDNGTDSPSSSPVPSSTGKTPAQPSPSPSPSPSGKSKVPKDEASCNPKKKRAVHDDSEYSLPSIPAPARNASLDFKPHRLSRVMARLIKPHSR